MKRPARKTFAQCEVARARTDAEREYATHVLAPAASRSFRFVRANGDLNHWFVLTWTPYALTLTGDSGEMTLTHYSALAEFEAGVRWVANSSSSYLLKKSDKALVRYLDKDATLDQLVEWANADAIYALSRRRSEAAERRAGARAGCWEWALDMEWWSASRDEPAPALAAYLPDEPDPVAFEFVGLRGRDGRSYAAPEGWESWYALWEEFHSRRGPEVVLTPAGRREVVEEARYQLSDATPDEVANACSRLGLDDYYGTYREDPKAVWQVEAIKRGCSLILDSLEPRRTWGREWGDPEGI